jgi:hypothetical protein
MMPFTVETHVFINGHNLPIKERKTSCKTNQLKSATLNE